MSGPEMPIGIWSRASSRKVAPLKVAEVRCQSEMPGRMGLAQSSPHRTSF